jgi:hypothetical protein
MKGAYLDLAVAALDSQGIKPPIETDVPVAGNGIAFAVKIASFN